VALKEEINMASMVFKTLLIPICMALCLTGARADDSGSAHSLLVSEQDMAKMADAGHPGKPVQKNQFQYKDAVGKMVNGQLRFTLNTNFWNRLVLNPGAPLSAKGLAFYFSSIQWSAGRHWPTYSSRCPRDDLLASDLFPSAKRHMIVVQFGGFYWDSCQNSETGVGTEITDVFVGVNDNMGMFDDNRGTFDMVVTGYSQ
jgi:hypothetical protein